MSDFKSLMLSDSRRVTLRASMVLATGYTCALTADDVLSFSFREGAEDGTMLCGGALCTEGKITLANANGEWRPGGSRLGSRTLMGAMITVEIGVWTGTAFLYETAARFIVSDIESSEGGTGLTLSGFDKMLYNLGVVFSDTQTYPRTLSQILAEIARQSGMTVLTYGTCNDSVSIEQKPEWGEKCTLRRALGWVAAAMGCFARVTVGDNIALLPVWGTTAVSVSAGDCFSMEISDTPFAFNRVRLVPYGAGENVFTDAAIDETLPAGASNTLEISDNALLRKNSDALAPIALGLKTFLTGMTLTPFSGAMPGRLDLCPGQKITLTDLQGTACAAVVFERQITLSDEFTLEFSCCPDVSGITLPRALTASGLLHGSSLSDGVVTARNLAAGCVDAEKITARAITADKIALGTLTSDSGVFGSLNANLIQSGKLSTDRLIIGGTEFSVVRALNQLAHALSENDDTIDGDVLTDGTIAACKVTDDFGTGLELSSNASVLLLAGKLDGTNSHMELTQDAVNIVGGDINIATEDLSIRGIAEGEERLSLDAAGLSAPTVTVTDSFFAPNAVLVQDTAVIPWRGGIQQSLNAIPRFLSTAATLTIPAGTYEEDVLVSGFLGERLTLLFQSGAVLRGHMRVAGCQFLYLTAPSAATAVICPCDTATPLMIESSRVHIENLIISGYRDRTTASDGTNCAVDTRISCVDARSVTVEYARYGFAIERCSMADIHNCRGGCSGTSPASNANLIAGIYVNLGGNVCISGTIPVGGSSSYLVTGGALAGTGTPTSGGWEYVPPVEFTKTYPCLWHCTYNGSARKEPSSYGIFYQGKYGKYERGMSTQIGAFWMDGVTELQGKNIVSATLSLTRGNVGSSDAKNVYLGTAALLKSQWESTFYPAVSSVEASGTLAREARGAFNVSRLMPQICQGYAFALHESVSSAYEGNYTPNYSCYYGCNAVAAPTLTVVYTEP